MSTTIIETKRSDQEIGQVISQVVKKIGENPDSAKATFNATSKLEHSFLTDVQVRNFNFISDEPEGLGGTDAGPNPVEYVLGALAACQEIVVKANAVALGINVQEVTVDVDGNLDLNGFLNLTDVRAGFTDINYITKIKTTETDPEKLEKLRELSFSRCPVLDIIKNPVPINGDVQFVK